jgi:acetyl-CoA decarbonylase/synthase complex subunit gamma
MALTGIQILKMLPKTNCGECGIPTCLAFGMKDRNRRMSLCKR